MNLAGTIALFRYWNRLRGTRPAPRRTEIEPADIKSLLADTMILERDTRGEAVFRLAGTRLCAIYGRELKGYSFPLLWSIRDQRMIARLVGSVFQEGAVVVVAFEGHGPDGKNNAFEMILLPLEGGLAGARCLGAIVPCRKPYWLGADAIVENRVDSIRVVDPERELDLPHADLAGPVPALAPGMSAMIDDDGASGRRVRHLVVFEGGREG